MRPVQLYIAQLKKLHELAERWTSYNLSHSAQQIPTWKPPPIPSIYSTETFTAECFHPNYATIFINISDKTSLFDLNAPQENQSS